MDRRTPSIVMTALVVVTLLAGVFVVAGRQADPDPVNASVAGLSAEELATSTTTTLPTTAPQVVTPTTAPPRTTVTTTKAPQPTSRITVEAVPAKPKAGETVRFVVTASLPGPCCYMLVESGDGGRPAPRSGPCTAGAGGTQRIEFTYVYNTPGTYNVDARADAGHACDHGPTAVPPVSTSISLVVAAGTTTSQGPAAPTIDLSLAAGAGGQVTLGGSVSDLDGWVSRVDIDWGDGSPATVVTQTQPCRPGTNGWPSSSILLGTLPPGAPISWTFTPVSHTYAAPGARAVKVTTVSTGCDGGNVQRATRTLS